MMTKHERKVYAWLARDWITVRQMRRMRRPIHRDVVRLMRLNKRVFVGELAIWLSETLLEDMLAEMSQHIHVEPLHATSE